MSLRQVIAFVFVVALAGCNPISDKSATTSSAGTPSSASTSLPATALATKGADIVAAGTGVTLGKGWYRYETYRGLHFRWVSNDARFLVHAPPATPLNLAFDVEAGPGLGTTNFTLLVKSSSGGTIARVPVKGKQSVIVTLPVTPGKDAAFSLHVDGGGQKVASDPRVLNFRVFSVAKSNGAQLASGGPDIVSDPDVELGKNWYPLEHFAGETFRWVDNDAQVIVTSKSAQTRRLKVVAAAGPSIVSPANFILQLRDKSGRPIQIGKIKARGTVYLELPLVAGLNTFALHADSTGRKAPNDARVLDFRVFSLSVQ
jgi:hypothetical protein